jgi:hypothetical protein
MPLTASSLQNPLDGVFADDDAMPGAEPDSGSTPQFVRSPASSRPLRPYPYWVLSVGL